MDEKEAECLSWPPLCLIKIWLGLFCVIAAFVFAVCLPASHLSRLSVRWCVWWLCDVQLVWLVCGSSWDWRSSCISGFSRACMSVCLSVCVCCCGGAEGPGSVLLYLFGQESFVLLGLKWPPLCLLSKPSQGQNINTNKQIHGQIKLNKMCLHMQEIHPLCMSEQVLSIFFAQTAVGCAALHFFLSRLWMITEWIASSAAILGKNKTQKSLSRKTLHQRAKTQKKTCF